MKAHRSNLGQRVVDSGRGRELFKCLTSKRPFVFEGKTYRVVLKKIDL